MHRHENRALNDLDNGVKITPISLVNRALEELTIRATAGAQRQRKSKLDCLCNSVMERNGKCSAIVRAMLETGISIKEVFEVYIPDVARLLGDYWVNSKLSFVEVTLATSRLQTLAREFERLYIGSINSGAHGPEILIVTPKGEQHTFGAQMASRKFRRLGASPYLSINHGKSEIKKILNKQDFKLVGLSISDYKLCDQQSELSSTIAMIKKLKIPIVAGGSIVQSSSSFLENLNVDLITDDAVHALSYFNISLSNKHRLLEPETN
jgi:methylmalonyl-CoA mutase cobalamin-binding subunit